MGQITSEFRYGNNTYLVEEKINLDESESRYNSNLVFEITKIKNGSYILDMSMKELRRVFPEMFKKKNIEILKLNANYLSTLPHNMKCMKNLRKLFIQHNNFKFLPAQLCRLCELEVLDVSYNQLQSIPNSVGHLNALINLNVSYNDIHSLPDSLQSLHNLEILDLDGNGFFEVPPVIFCLKSLRILKMNRNNVTYLPKGFTRLKHLREFYVSDNNITKINIDIRHFLKALTIFDISRNNKQIFRNKIELGNLDKLNDAEECSENLTRTLPCTPKHDQSKLDYFVKSRSPLNDVEDVYVFKSYAFSHSSFSSLCPGSAERNTSL